MHSGASALAAHQTKGRGEGVVAVVAAAAAERCS